MMSVVNLDAYAAHSDPAVTASLLPRRMMHVLPVFLSEKETAP
jgi:hypothetical protein